MDRVALWIGWILIKKIIAKIKKIGIKATYATHDLIVRTQQQKMLQSLRKQEEELKQKFAEAALDEMAREAVRQAMRENLNTEKFEIELCKFCKGNGCCHCGQKGWLFTEN